MEILYIYTEKKSKQLTISSWKKIVLLLVFASSRKFPNIGKMKKVY